MGRKRKLRFHVSLEDLDMPEVSLKELAASNGIEEEGASPNENLLESPSKHPYDEWHDRPHNILSQLEAKYSAHPKIKENKARPTKASGEAGEANGAVRKRRRRDDEEYDLDDPFIDDSELMEVFEKQDEAEATVTKYHGFFVNHGDLEVSHVVNEENLAKEPKKRGRRKGAAVNGVKTDEGANDDETWLLSDEVKAAFAKFREIMWAWKENHQAEAATLKELPLELQDAAMELDDVVRGKGRIVSIGEGYCKALKEVLHLSKATWKKMIKGVAARRVQARKAKVDAALILMQHLYTQRRESMLSNTKHSIGQSQESPSSGSPTSVSQGGGQVLSKDVPLDNALRQALFDILEDVKAYCTAKSIHLLSLGKVPPSYEEEELEALKEVAGFWPPGTMKIQRLKKVYADHLATLGPREETLIMLPPLPVRQSSTASGRDSATPSVAEEGKVGEKKERKKRSKSTEGDGAAPKKPRQRKTSSTSAAAATGGVGKDDGTTITTAENGGTNGQAAVKTASKVPSAAPKTAAAGGSKAAGAKAAGATTKSRPSGPVMGRIGPLKRQYNEGDFEPA